MKPNFDMNLFIVFHTLFEERSVTRTGERLGRTQSAVSNALRRLRDLFDDPLFVRTPSGLAATPRAEELAKNINQIVDLAEQCVQPEFEFDPSQSSAKFVLGAPDRLSLPVFLPFLEQLRKTAPGITIDLRTTDPDSAIQLISDGSIDLALGWFEDLQHSSTGCMVSKSRWSVCAPKIIRFFSMLARSTSGQYCRTLI